MSLPKVWLNGVNSSCCFSSDRAYRYWLSRFIGESFRIRVCIGLNPSTADEMRDDPTVRRLVTRAHEDGFGTFVMLNLFSYRSTDPREMMRNLYPIGETNNATIKTFAAKSEQVVLCWGAHGSHRGRSAQVLDMLRPYASKLYCFGLTKSGEPRHPLYLPKNTPLVKWEYST